MVRLLLESDGIECLVKNEYGAHTAGGGIGFAMAFAWPEIWVSDNDAARAEVIITQFRKAGEDKGELE